MDSTARVNGTDLNYIEQCQGQPVVFVHVGFGDYFRIGLPLTLATLLVGTIWFLVSL